MESRKYAARRRSSSGVTQNLARLLSSRLLGDSTVVRIGLFPVASAPAIGRRWIR